MTGNRLGSRVLIALMTALGLAGAARADSLAAFSYQGFLRDDGVPADGVYDFRFSAWDAATGGTQIGSTIEQTLTVEDGYFTTVLNAADEYSSDLFWGTAEAWIEVEVSDDGGATFAKLDPRQQIFRSPFATTSSGVYVPVGMPLPLAPDSAVVDVCVDQFAQPAKFLIDNVLNTATAMLVQSNGLGPSLTAVSSASAEAVLATASGTGTAGRFEITNAASAADALFAQTIGSGRGLRAFSTSGLGILAESTTGIGLRAISATGNALEVVGTALFSGATTFNALSTHNARVIITTTSGQASLRVTNTGAGLAGEFNGAVNITGEVTRDFVAGVPARVGPIAYGSVQDDGITILFSATPNVTSVIFDGQRYRVTIVGENYTSQDYVATVTPVSNAGPPRLATTTAVGGDLAVRIFGLDGGLVRQPFHFVVHKP